MKKTVPNLVLSGLLMGSSFVLLAPTSNANAQENVEKSSPTTNSTLTSEQMKEFQSN